MTALAAFLSGVASVVTAGYAIRRILARADEECDRRLAAFRDGLREARG